MLQSHFRKFIAQLPQRTHNQPALLKQRVTDSPECPHCHSSLINRHGKTNDIQRYLCKNCLKTFAATTGTPLARLRYKEQWVNYMKCMLDSKVLRVCAKECGID